MATRGRKKGNSEKAVERELRALEMRKAGSTYRQIGTALRISEAQAHRDVKNVLTHMVEQSAEEIEEMRMLENARLDGLWQKMYDKATKDGDTNAVMRCIQISRRRSEINGLDTDRNKLTVGEIEAWFNRMRTELYRQLGSELADKVLYLMAEASGLARASQNDIKQLEKSDEEIPMPPASGFGYGPAPKY